MWFFYNAAVARNIFHASSETDPLYGEGTNFGGLTLAFYNVIAFAFSFVLPLIAKKLGRKLTHSICLLAGAVGLISVAFVENKFMLYGCMTGVGIAWASILSMPYAMLSGVLPLIRWVFIWVSLTSLLYSPKSLPRWDLDGSCAMC